MELDCLKLLSKKDPDGIPILNRNEIEELAKKLLTSFDPTALNSITLTPLMEIANFLNSPAIPENDRLTIIFNKELGTSNVGQKYLGRFHIKSRTIFIAPWLVVADYNSDPRFCFTLAHEIGHYILHREVQLRGPHNEFEKELSDSEDDLFLDRTAIKNSPRDWLEWQANCYASSLIMPKEPLIFGLQKF